MKTKNKQRNNKKISIIILVLLLLLASGGGVFWWLKTQKEQSDQKTSTSLSNQKDSKTQNESSTEISKEKDVETLNKTETKTTPSNTDRAEGTTDKNTGNTTFPTYVTAEVADGRVRIAGQISGLEYDDGTGKCSFELTSPSGEKTEVQTTILESPNNKYCKAITKNFSELSSGTWKVVAKYENTNQKYKGMSDVQSFRIQK